MTHTDICDALTAIPPDSRERLRRPLISDQIDRDEIAMQLLRYQDAVSDELADIIDMLTMVLCLEPSTPDCRYVSTSRACWRRAASLPGVGSACRCTTFHRLSSRRNTSVTRSS